MTTEQPVLESKRLLLRPFSLTDAPVVQKLAGDEAIAATTLNIPHPYEDGMAEEWIGSHQERFEKGEAVIFAITLRDEKALIGAIGLEINQLHERAGESDHPQKNRYRWCVRRQRLQALLMWFSGNLEKFF